MRVVSLGSGFISLPSESTYTESATVSAMWPFFFFLFESGTPGFATIAMAMETSVRTAIVDCFLIKNNWILIQTFVPTHGTFPPLPHQIS